MKIPLADLSAQYLSIKGEIDSAIASCIDSGNFIKGSSVHDFEAAFAEYTGAKHCVSCANGTDALEIILKALNIGIGDEVIIPALTWISTAEAVSNVGAEPVFADVNAGSYNIDLKSIIKKITPRTKAIIPVHLYGYPADMNEINALAKTHGINIIEDCAQAHGAEYEGRKVGTFGIAAAFSFFPSKNLGCMGDGGAIMTNDDGLAEMIRKLANHGQLNERHRHLIIGRNSRLDSIQAAVLNVKLKYLEGWNSRRREVAAYYVSRFRDKKELKIPSTSKDRTHVYHQFVIFCRNRAKLIKLLDQREISWAIHYPKAIPFQEAYAYQHHSREDFKVAYDITRGIISIPVYPELSEEQLEIICDQVLKYHD